MTTRRTFSPAASIVLLCAMGLASSCAPTAAPAKQQSAESRTQGADVMGYPQSNDSTATPGPGSSFELKPTALATEEQNLDAAEKELLAALEGNTADGERLAAETDRCSIVCKALVSMQKSVKHLCSLSADRCTAANERLKSAEERARSGCPSCATPT